MEKEKLDSHRKNPARGHAIYATQGSNFDDLILEGHGQTIHHRWEINPENYSGGNSVTLPLLVAA